MSATDSVASIRKTITVQTPVETAFAFFTRGISGWWPKDSHSIFGDEVEEVVFEPRVGGLLYELTGDGRRAEWADVVVWEPPHRLVLSWRVNPDRGATEVEVRFTAEGDGTRVELEHRGWDRVGDPEGRADYDSGWDVVLGRYAGAPPAGG